MTGSHPLTILSWVVTWDDLETSGLVDSWGSVEYRRLLNLWIEQGCCLPVRAWLIQQAQLDTTPPPP